MALAALKERVDIWSECHPPLSIPWQDGQLGAEEVLKLLEETLQSVELEEELWVPRLGAREATMFHPGYGLIPCPEKALWTIIGGDSDRFPKVVFVVRTKTTLGNLLRREEEQLRETFSMKTLPCFPTKVRWIAL